MFSLRTAAVVRAACKSAATPKQHPFQGVAGANAARYFSSVAKPGGDEDDEDALSVVEQRKEELQKRGKHLIWESPEAVPAPYLPENLNELTSLDPADLHTRKKADGSDRFVIIRQNRANVKQSPLDPEKRWKIAFVEDGIGAEKWKNSLMNWTSNADPYQSEPPLFFENAQDAVYFAKKRGWRFLIKEPVRRILRDDGQQYQDNFLPQKVAAKISKDGHACDHWFRSEGCASHYFRPLKYHGDGTVRQHGPNMNDAIAPDVQGQYKIR